MQLDIVDLICAYVETVLEPPFPIYADEMPRAEGDCACLRHDPSPAAERLFQDGSRFLRWNLTFHVRCKSAASARGYAKEILDSLEGKTITDPKTGTRVEAEAATLPQFIGVDEKNQTTYSAAIAARYAE